SNNGNLLSITLDVTNESVLEANPLDYKFGFKGGQFEVYWEDASGIRTKIDALTIKRGGQTEIWDEQSTLDYNEKISICFDDTAENTLENARKFIVVYKGNIINESGYVIDQDDTEAIAVSIVDADHIHNIPTSAFLLARFKGIDNCDPAYPPDTLFNNHGFRLQYVDIQNGYWMGNDDYSGRKIWVSDNYINNRDRIWIDVKDVYNIGDRRFNSGDWDNLQYFPEIVTNACTCVYYNSHEWYGGTCTISFWNIPSWQSGTSYKAGNQVGWDSPEGDTFEVYTCTVNHNASSATEPGQGGNWNDCWLLGYPDVKADIDIDEVSENSEEDPGGTVQIGGSLKKINALILSSWPDVWTNELDRGSATLEVVTGTDKIRIWDNPNKTGQPIIDQGALRKKWLLDSETVPISLYVEGLSSSESAMDVRLRFSLDYAGVNKYDKVNFTVQN
ncbi:MAG: hypothetical protein JXA01_09965, partial [Dehalococcoidia bacterium]|nr:hypothetical protein [Dehalococcoidia bacterium]